MTMHISSLLVFNSDKLRAEPKFYPTWTGVKICDDVTFNIELHFDLPGHARKAKRLADAINQAMRDPSEDPAERAKLHAIFAPVEAPNEFYRD